MTAAVLLSSDIGIKPACEALDLSRAGFYRNQTSVVREHARQAVIHPRALRPKEQEKVLEVLHSERFIDQAPQAVYADLGHNPLGGRAMGYSMVGVMGISKLKGGNGSDCLCFPCAQGAKHGVHV